MDMEPRHLKEARQQDSLSLSISCSLSHTLKHRVSLSISLSLCSVILLPHSSNLRGILMVSSISTLPLAFAPGCLYPAHTWREHLSLVPNSINSHPAPLPKPSLTSLSWAQGCSQDKRKLDKASIAWHALRVYDSEQKHLFLISKWKCSWSLGCWGKWDQVKYEV